MLITKMHQFIFPKSIIYKFIINLINILYGYIKTIHNTSKVINVITNIFSKLLQ